MKVLVAPDKFKGSLTGPAAADAMAAGVIAALPDADVVRLPIADGGEGTVEAAVAAGFERRIIRVSGPVGEPVDAAYAFRGGVAVVELAQASGLSLVRGHMEPLTATSRGAGELMLDAVRSGASTVVLGVGGSACTDAGAGLLAALGARFLDGAGRPLPDGGGALVDLATVHAPPPLGADVVLAADVDNPLLGPDGAAAVYGPQKGASPSDVATLEAGLARFAAVVSADGAAVSPGAGAAGGVGFGVMALLGARRRPGFDVIADVTGVDGVLAAVDLTITGEGSLDAQSLHGKAPIALADRAAAAGVDVLILCGACDVDEADLAAHGVVGCRTLTELEPDRQKCFDNAADLLKRLGTDEIRRYAAHAR